MNGGRLAWANSLRGIAAATVMVGHVMVGTISMQRIAEASVRYPVGQQLVDDLGVERAVDWLGFDFMGAGVCLFFLLSGLVISRSLRRYSRGGFLVGRVLRLLPTFAAGYAVILVAVAALALATQRPVPVGPGEALGVIPGLPQLVGVDVIPNDVAWTLIVEMVFYVVCVVLHRTLLDRAWVLLAVAAGCVAVQQAFLQVTPQSYPLAGIRDLVLVAVPFIPILLMGVRLDSLDPRQGIPPRDWAVLGLLVAAFWWMTGFRVWWPFSPLGTQGAGMSYQITFVLTIVAFIAVWRWADPRFDGPVLRWLADISYPLYVVHLMIGWVLILGLAGAGVPVPLAQASAIVAALGLAWILHVLVEQPSHRIGRQWARQLSPESSLDPTDHQASATVNGRER